MTELIERYRKIPTATVCDGLLRTGNTALNRFVLAGLAAHGSPPTGDISVVGLARTQSVRPVRDPMRMSMVSDRARHFQLVDEAGPDDFLVISTGGAVDVACFGDMLAMRAHARGAVGVALDGASRDVSLIESIGLGLWCVGLTPIPMGSRGFSVESVNEPIVCGGVEVFPGDVIVGDADGVVAVPAADAQALLIVCEELEATEETARDGVRAGRNLADLYPSRAYYAAAETEAPASEGETDHA